MTMSEAFLPPSSALLSRRQHGPFTSSRRPSRRAPSHRACLPPENEEERRSFQIKTSQQQEDPPTNNELDETEETFSELDELAEEWIGADLGRWEWYERMKSRRQKLLCVVRVREEELNHEFEELRRTFMEFDALFGTKMLDDQSGISPSGWGTVALIMLGYVAVGYWLVEMVVKAFTDYSPGFPL